jgi:CHAT domain-containing protein
MDLLTASALTSTRTDEGEVQDVLKQEADLLNRMQSHERTVCEEHPVTNVMAENNNQLSRDLEAELDAAYEALEAYDPQYVLQKRGVPVDIARAQALLSTFDRPAVVVTFDFVGDEITAMMLRRDQDEPVICPTGMSRAQLEELLKTFHLEMHEYQGEGVESWRDQAKVLFHDVAETICEDDLVVLIAEGDLQQLPLHALRLPSGQLLVEAASVVYEPSLTVLEVLQKSRSASEKSFFRFVSVGVAFPDEARAVSMRFGRVGMCLSGNNLDKDEVRGFLSDSRIVHFACHGRFDPHNYLESGLVLRITDTPLRKEILSLRDLMTWHLDSDLVVLSACDTGRGTVASSEFLGLGRGFLAAGARAIIATLWKIDDAATQAFMLTFYDNLRHQLNAGDTIDLAGALRQTQCQYARTSKTYYWAGFKLIGQPIIRWKGENYA